MKYFSLKGHHNASHWESVLDLLMVLFYSQKKVF